jgi:hypothetical protein
MTPDRQPAAEPQSNIRRFTAALSPAPQPESQPEAQPYVGHSGWRRPKAVRVSLWPGAGAGANRRLAA